VGDADVSKALEPFPQLQEHGKVVPVCRKLSLLGADFKRWFGDFEAQKNRFQLLNNLFTDVAEGAPSHIQMNWPSSSVVTHCRKLRFRGRRPVARF